MDPFTSDLFSVFNVNSSNNAPKKRKNIEELAEEAKLEVLSSNQHNKKKQKLSTTSTKTLDLNIEVIEDSDDDVIETSANGSNDKIVEQKESGTKEGEKKVISTDKEVPKSVVMSHITPITMIDASMNAKLGEKNACLHEVALPPDFKQKLGPDITDEDVQKMLFDPASHTLLPDYKPAKQYPFTLDAFQEEAVKSIERGQSVLVSAHTSAGKTAVAEYAIALSLKKGSRVVYTSPIKALSNQKYRELQEEFEDVGLMTGDVTISPNASCIVMTTEILRSMLYRGSELLNEVAWVIFDEVHYMRDKERGVVWEETLILLPNTVRYVFLSATIPNAMEFAEWIAKLKGQPVHVVYTDYRPTPLQHYIYPSGGDGIHLVVDGKTGFREEAFRLAIEALNNTNAATLQSNGEGGQQPKSLARNLKEIQGNNVYRLVNMIMKRNFQPVIVFSFSRKDCENRALAMSKLDLLNGDEEEISLVEEVFHNAIDALSEDDKKLPQVEHMLPLLKKGIGIHHSGLLPIIKEVIEILFQEGLVKVLFATETFAMGLNMPARTVLFTSCEKFDGRDFRHITSGEYIQMSGRAGRRGIDDKGIVILMLEKEIDLSTIKQIMSGMPDPLNSSFHLSYYMILNLLRVEEISPQYIMERSFYQFQSEKLRPALEAELKKLEEQHSAIVIENEQQVATYYRIRQELMELKRKIQQEVNKPAYCLNFVNTGRLVKVNCSNTTSSTDELSSATNEDWGWGVIVNYQKKKNVMNTSSIKELKSSDYTVDILLQCAPNSDGKPRPFNKDKLKNIQDGNEQKNNSKGKRKKDKKSGNNNDNSNIKPDYVILPVDLTYIEKWSSIRIYMSKNLKNKDNMESCYARVAEAERRLKNSNSGIPLLDPIEDMKIPAEKLQDTIKRVESLEQRLVTNEIHKHERLEELYNAYMQKLKLEEEISELKKSIRAAGQLALKEDLKKMTRVLRRLDCISNPDTSDAKSDGVITVKGRVACEISSADELVITELIFNGILNDLTPEQVVALMSCCAFQEGGSSGGKKDSDPVSALPEELKMPYKELVKAAKRVAKVSIESKIEMDEDEYIGSFNPELMQVTYAWCHGAKFHEICKMTDVFEGSIVRVMRRLEELLRQMCAAAKAIGDDVLEAKLNEGINKLKKDIVFSSSLYL